MTFFLLSCQITSRGTPTPFQAFVPPGSKLLTYGVWLVHISFKYELCWACVLASIISQTMFMYPTVISYKWKTIINPISLSLSLYGSVVVHWGAGCFLSHFCCEITRTRRGTRRLLQFVKLLKYPVMAEQQKPNLSEVESFQHSNLKHVKTTEKNTLPSDESEYFSCTLDARISFSPVFCISLTYSLLVLLYLKSNGACNSSSWILRHSFYMGEASARL